MQAVITQLRNEGMSITDADLARLSPARYAHINPFGKYSFELSVEPGQLRPLRPGWKKIVGFFANSKETPYSPA